MAAAKDEFDIVDQFDDESGKESRGKRDQDKRSNTQRDDEDFDPLDRNIDFPDDEESGEHNERDENRDEEEIQNEDDEDEDERGARRQSRGHEDEDEDEDERGGERWRRRLARERRLREEAEADAETYQSGFERLSKQLQDLSTKVDGQKSGVEIDAKISELTRKLEKVRVSLKAAQEAGDADKVSECVEEIADIKGDIKMAEYQKTQAKTVKTDDKSTEVPAINRHLTRWMRQHGRRFNTDPEFKAVATAMSGALVNEGLAGTSTAHFEELDKRLSKLYPKEFPNLKHRDERGGKRPRAPISADGDGGAPPARDKVRGDGLDIKVRGKKAQLTERHESIMSKFGLDPNDPKDRQTFVRENVATKRK